jgi:hypothetical protein
MHPPAAAGEAVRTQPEWVSEALRDSASPMRLAHRVAIPSEDEE